MNGDTAYNRVTRLLILNVKDTISDYYSGTGYAFHCFEWLSELLFQGQGTVRYCKLVTCLTVKQKAVL